MFRFIAIIIILSSCSAAVRSDEVPDHLREQVEKVWALQEKEIARLERQLEWPTADNGKKKKLTKEQRKNRLKSARRIEKKIKAIEKGELPHIGLDFSDLTVGEIGHLNAESFEVLNILGEEKMLIVPVRTATSFSYSGFRMSQSFYDKRGEPLMCCGWKTNGIASGTEMKPVAGWIEVTGTERYASVGGMKTVFVIRPFDVKAVRPHLKLKSRDR